LISVHRHFQSGRGSGLDIAASLSGGVISYRMNGAGDTPTVAPRPLPESLRTMAVWSGHAASTGAALESLERWRAHAPAEHARSLAELGELAVAADDAANARDAARLLAAIAAYAEVLRRFGAASGIEIYGSGHARISSLAREHAVVYKPCGAGGGDLGVACSEDDASLAALRASLERAGFRALDVAIDPVGLQVQASVE
jgi:phosphomevalonate kinase